MKYLKKFIQLNESNRVKIFLDDVEWWLDRDDFILYQKVDSVDGFSLGYLKLTKDQKNYISDIIKYAK
jgi:hypothetical protein